MKKKFLKIVLILVLIFASMFVLTACDSENEEESSSRKEDSTVIKNEKSLNDEVEKEVQEPEKEEISEEEAEGLIKKYYDIAESLYFLADDYFDIDMNGDGSEYVVKYPISNYEEVIDEYISKDFKEEFYPALLLKEDGKYYLGIGGFAQGYDNLRFEDIEIEDNRISCTAILDLYVVDELIEKDAEAGFSIVKENGNWKIEDFTAFTALGY